MSFKSKHEFSKDETKKDRLQCKCKVCDKKRADAYQKTKPGVVTSIYHHQKLTSKKKGWPPPDYSKTELLERLFREPNFHKHFGIWEADGCINPLLKPSFDRKNDYEPYTFENLLRICSWGENKNRYHQDAIDGINNKMSKAVIQMDLEGNFIKEFYSQSQASRETKVCNVNISSCCNGKYNTAGGFKWKFKETESQ